MVVLFLGGVFLAAVLLTGVVRRYALHRKMMDVPNARSSHTVATPRGGGVAVVVTALAGVVGLWFLGALADYVFLGLFLGGLLVAGIGYLDDNRHVPARWRILVHLAAAVVVVVCAGTLPPSPILAVEVTPGLLGSAVAVLFVVWNLNLYNFMDGIDGIAGVEAVTVCVGAALLLWSVAELELALLVALYGAASLGFLVWNWPPAKIFMGDSGSGFLGFSLAALAMLTYAQAGFPVWGWLILLGVFIVDATVTLVRRVLRGERWYQAHRSHAYQHASRRYGAHLPVTMVVALINVFWLLPLAWLSVHWPAWGVAFLAMAWLPLFVVALRFRAGVSE